MSPSDAIIPHSGKLVQLKPFSNDLGLANSFSFRALNHDNQKDTAKIVELFKGHYGEGHPDKRVYDYQFWAHISDDRIGRTSFVSLVAERDDRFIAHLAVALNHQNLVAQLLLPAIGPQYREHLFKIVRGFWSLIEKIAERQRWRAIFSYCDTSQPLLQVLAAKCFNSEVAAIIPSFRRKSKGGKLGLVDRNGNSSLCLMYHVFEDGRKETTSLFPPDNHKAKIAELYSNLNLQNGCRERKESSLSSSLQPNVLEYGYNECSLEPSSRSFSQRLLKTFGINEIILSANIIANSAAALHLVERLETAAKGREPKRNDPNRNDQVTVIHIPLTSPACPPFCTALEDKGYHFCGIFPLSAEADCILYSKGDMTSLQRATLYTNAAKELRDYILDSAASYAGLTTSESAYSCELPL